MSGKGPACSPEAGADVETGWQQSQRPAWGSNGGSPEAGARAGPEVPACGAQGAVSTVAPAVQGWRDKGQAPVGAAGAACQGALHAHSSFCSDQEATGVKRDLNPIR